MGVAIDESGQNQRIFGIDRTSGGILGFELEAWTDRDNRVARHDNRAVVVDVSSSIHGDDGSTGDDEIGFHFGRLRDKENGQEEEKRKERNDRSMHGHLFPQRRRPRQIALTGLTSSRLHP